MGKTLWILTEERPKRTVVRDIINRFLRLRGTDDLVGELEILPRFSSEGSFLMEYQVVGVSSHFFENIQLRVVSGNSSFTDYLVYWQEELPTPSDRPEFVVEETKTDDSESRNTGAFQRATKFVYLDLFYEGVDRAMLYNIQIDHESSASPTNVFGTRCLRTLGVEILGKEDDAKSSEPFKDLDEMIEARARIRRPPRGNVPILVERSRDSISISGRLVKSGGLSHDPNIGAISLIAAVTRKLGWEGRIEVTHHGLSQSMLGPRNKFVQIGNHLDLELKGLSLPVAETPGTYWKFETSGEKVATIFLHLAIERSNLGEIIFENHAGCERGYFVGANKSLMQVSKRVRDSRGGMPSGAEAVQLPDLVIHDSMRNEVLMIEGERSQNLSVGIQQLQTFRNFETEYVIRQYPGIRTQRVIVLFGGKKARSLPTEVAFQLTDDGAFNFGRDCPPLISNVINSQINRVEEL